jgi:putative glutamine amidotransferase
LKIEHPYVKQNKWESHNTEHTRCCFCFERLFLQYSCRLLMRILKQQLNGLSRIESKGGGNMRPLIGLTMSLQEERRQTLSRDYSDAVRNAGGTPVAIPYCNDPEAVSEMASRLDGVVLTGGGDIDPSLFEEEPLPGLGEIVPERDRMETELVRLLLERDKPLLAVCRGCQILNIAVGGDMYQDLYTQRDGLLQHHQRSPRHHATHAIQLVEGTLLHRLAQTNTVRVNSFHHQAVRRVPSPLRVAARTVDGVIEAIESARHRFVVGVQWHPECMAKTDAFSRRLFEALVEAAERRIGRSGKGGVMSVGE